MIVFKPMGAGTESLEEELPKPHSGYQVPAGWIEIRRRARLALSGSSIRFVLARRACYSGRRCS